VGRAGVSGARAAEQLSDVVGVHTKSLDDSPPNLPPDSAFTEEGYASL
jgi:hypothetical protein